MVSFLDGLLTRVIGNLHPNVSKILVIFFVISNFFIHDICILKHYAMFLLKFYNVSNTQPLYFMFIFSFISCCLISKMRPVIRMKYITSLWLLSIPRMKNCMTNCQFKRNRLFYYSKVNVKS